MMGLAYSIFLKLFYPTSVCLILLLAAAAFRKRRVLNRACFWTAIAVLMVCGNGWLVDGLTRHLERQYLTPNPVPHVDAILILSGGIADQVPPRPSVELADGADRMFYGAGLYRQGKAPWVVCTGGVATGGLALRPAAEVMADFLGNLGVPRDAIIMETASQNTHQHAERLGPLLSERGFSRVLLVTSAAHMPRSMATFERLIPGVEFIAAPTDFRAPDRGPAPWYRQITNVIPTPGSLLGFSEVMHEYLGIVYYGIRGWT